MSGLLLVGDTAWPVANCLDVSELGAKFSGLSVVVNLEGPILANDPESAAVLDELKFNLFSHPDFIEVAKSLGIEACGFANNHITDYLGAVETTHCALDSAGIKVFGTVERPYCELMVGNQHFIIVGACSRLPEPVKTKGRLTPNLFEPRRLIRQLVHLRRRNPASKLIVFVHWGYELSLYPEPADREWARLAIDVGADYVVGHHSHVVQGVERYRHGVIAYSLGNFLLPQVRFRNRVLRFATDKVLPQLGICFSEGHTRLFWMRYAVGSASVRVEYVSDAFEEDERNKSNTPFAGMSIQQYREWFKSTGRNGVLTQRRSGPVFWSYTGLEAVDSALKFAFMTFKRVARRVAILSGIHRPYNW